MGAVKSLDSQEVLEQLAINIGRTPEALKDVEVRLCPEPECKYGGSWRRIDYIVHVQDALDTVHQALANNTITAVRFNWIRFLLCFPRSGIGYYAAICITKVQDIGHTRPNYVLVSCSSNTVIQQNTSVY